MKSNTLEKNVNFIYSATEISEEYSAIQDGFCPICSHGKGNMAECLRSAELVRCKEDEWCGVGEEMEDYFSSVTPKLVRIGIAQKLEHKRRNIKLFRDNLSTSFFIC